MSRNLVVKDNALINASYNLDLIEQRLILLAIIEARATGKGINPNDRLTVTASSYMNAFNTTRQTAYDVLKDACNNLFERQFSFIEHTDKGVQVVRSRWVSEVAYIEKTATVKLTFAPAVVPLITLLEKKFTSYDLEQVAGLNSRYAVRLYEIVIAWKNNGKTNQIEVQELRNRLGVLDDEYTAMGDFKKRVLDLSIKQINEKTDITLSYEQHKEGRNIIGFTFTIKTKNTPKKLAKSPQKPQQNQKQDFTDDDILRKQINFINSYTYLDGNEKIVIQKRIDVYTKKLQCRGVVVDEKYLKNIVSRAVKERWGLAEYEKEQAELQAKKQRQEQQRAERLAKEQAEQAKKEQETKRRVDMIAKFEALPPALQNIILDEVFKKIDNASFAKSFKELRAENTAHKSPMFASYFYELLD